MVFPPELLKFSSVLHEFYFQAAVYGLGVCAEFGGAAFKPLVGGMFYLHIVGKLISFAIVL